MMLNNIVLPAETKTLTVREIPRLFALSMHPDKLYVSAVAHEAIEHKGELVQVTPDDGRNAKIVQAAAEREHREKLTAAIKKGELVALSPLTFAPDSTAQGEQLQSLIVTIDALKEYAARFQIGIQEATPAAKDEVRLSVTDQQNNEILNWLKSKKHNPLKMPVPPSGKSGVKKLCRDAVKFSSKSVFNTAWDRLRLNGAIKDEK